MKNKKGLDQREKVLNLLKDIKNGQALTSAKTLRLREVCLAGEDLSGMDLSGADLTASDLSGAKLFKTKLKRANLPRANLKGADLTGADLTEANLEDINASQAGLGMACLKGAHLFRANLKGSTLSKADLREADLRHTCLRNARLREADLSYADLTGADLETADLALSSVAGATFKDADIRDARLRLIKGYEKASWIGADIRDINFAGAYRLRRFVADQNYLKEFREYSRLSAATYHLWWLTSDCGRSIARWCLCIVILVVFFGFLYLSVELDYGNHSTTLSPFYYSVVTMTTLGYGDVVPASPAAQVIAMVEVSVGYIMLGGLLSIFNNKLARRAD